MRLLLSEARGLQARRSAIAGIPKPSCSTGLCMLRIREKSLLSVSQDVAVARLERGQSPGVKSFDMRHCKVSQGPRGATSSRQAALAQLGPGKQRP